MSKGGPGTAWRRGRAGFTIIELMAAIALLIILMVILFVVFGAAGKAVQIGKSRMERYASVRAVFRLMEDDITSAFLISDYNDPPLYPRYGFTGEDGRDEPFLKDSTGSFLPASDRLTLIRPRRGYDPANPKPGIVDVCYLRVNSFPGYPDRPNVLLRVMDQEEAPGHLRWRGKLGGGRCSAPGASGPGNTIPG